MSLWRGVTVKVRPTSDPLTVEDLKAWTRVEAETAEEDVILQRSIRDAVRRIDGPAGIGVAMMEQTWRKSFDAFPRCILLPGWPIKSVTAITYTDADGVEQAVDAEAYRVDLDAEPARVEPVHGTAWPTARDVIGAVKVDYKLGETNATNVPEDLVNAICLYAAHRYEHRSAVDDGSLAAVPLGFESILSEYRRGTVAA